MEKFNCIWLKRRELPPYYDHSGGGVWCRNALSFIILALMIPCVSVSVSRNIIKRKEEK